MRIEDKIRNMTVTPPARHQELLRARLLAHTEETKVKTKKFRTVSWLAVGIVPLAALSLLVIVNVWQPSQRPNGIVEELTQQLTSKQVFAKAAQISKKQSEFDDSYVFYQKMLLHEYTGSCVPYEEYTVNYTSDAGKVLKTQLLDQQNRVFTSIKFDEGYKPIDIQYEVDPLAQNPNRYLANSPDQCPSDRSYSEEENAEFTRYGEAIARAYHYVPTNEKGLLAGAYLLTADLQSGSPARQAKALDVLSSIDGMKIRQDVKRPETGSRPLIEASFTTSKGKYYNRYFFDSVSKEFVGYDNKEALSGDMPFSGFIVEQGVRPASEAK